MLEISTKKVRETIQEAFDNDSKFKKTKGIDRAPVDLTGLNVFFDESGCFDENKFAFGEWD